MRRLFFLFVICLGLTINLSLAQSETSVADGNNAFAFDLYQQIIAENDGNLIFSPYSISLAFGMAYAGARGGTADEIAEVMHFLPQGELPAAFGALNTQLAESAELPDYMEGDPIQLTIANALWGQQDFGFNPDFLNVLEVDYGAPMQFVDYINAPEPARQQINDWVEEQTRERITDLVPEGVITPMTRLVLANAIYFKASWESPFPEFLTADAPFTLLNGDTVTVPFMSQQNGYLYAQGEGYQAVELPYIGGQVGMLVIMPEDFEAFEKTLNAETFSEIQPSLAPQEVALAMPKFEYTADFKLADAMQSMGMTLAFSDEADFSGMGDEALNISEVLHKAYIGVDESGTEAAAATALIMEATSAMPEEPISLTLDRPFVYMIYDRPSGAVLFVGRVLNPAE